MKKQIRVRFAPSPTGPLHIGGIRTALYNYLFSVKMKGKFILRIEDTDQSRYIPGAEDYILNSLNWCGFKINEGPEIGGKYGPYRQSERKEIYKEFADRLVEEGVAYYAFDTEKELEIMREDLRKAGVQSPQYNHISRQNMKNSLTLSQEEVANRLKNNQKYVIRINIPRNETVKFKDNIRGWVSFNTNHLDDKVLYKSDGMPTYHLANVVDDYLMKISHVIRGEEWLPSAPLHVFLYKSFGWENEMPEFAHLPLILNPEGDGKLSKRDGDRLGFPVFPIEWINPETKNTVKGYRELGFFPEAFINMLAFLGWNPGTNQEIFSIKELINTFNIERVGKSGARYNYQKMKWFNQQYLRLKNNMDILDQLSSTIKEKKITHNQEYLLQVIDLVKERSTFIEDIFEEGCYLLNPPKKYDQASVDKKWNKDTVTHLLALKGKFLDLKDFSKQNLETNFQKYLESTNSGFGKVMPGLRISITGKMEGPSMFSVMGLLGHKEVIDRINKSVKILGNG